MNNTAKRNTFGIVTAALFTAVITVCSQISIPMPSNVPLTLQTFGIALCGYVSGVKWGFASITAYVLLGAVGVPVFAGFKGGIQSLFAASGGFIYGFILLAVLCGLSQYTRNRWLKILCGFAGLAACHILGTVHFSFVYKTGIISSFLMVSAPYLIKDAVSVILAQLLSVYIKKPLAKISAQKNF